MRRRQSDITLTVALCLSLIVHAWIVQAATWRYVRDNARLFLPGPPTVPEIAIVPPQRPPMPPPEQPAPMFDPMDQLGDSEGNPTAGATAATPGDTPMRAPQANQEQGALSLDPSGAGDGGAEQAPAPTALARPPSAATPVFQPQPPSPPLALPQESASSDREPIARRPRETEPEKTGESPRPQDPPEPSIIAIREPGPERHTEPERPTQDGPESEAEADKPPEPTLPEAAVAANTLSPQAPAQPPAPPVMAAANSRAADPAPQAESESDPFSTEAAVDFASGKTTARVGRKHKIYRPKIEMAGYADLMQLRGPVVVVLKLHIDEAGNVEKVEILKSSGSINIDQPTLIAAYRWWFEPTKDSAGRPKKDVIRFTCRFV